MHDDDDLTAPNLEPRLTVLAARDVQLADRIVELEIERTAIKQAILIATKGEPDRYAAGRLTVIVSTNRRFDVKAAMKLVPEELVDEVTVVQRTIDKDRLALILPEVHEACWKYFDPKVTIS